MYQRVFHNPFFLGGLITATLLAFIGLGLEFLGGPSSAAYADEKKRPETPIVEKYEWNSVGFSDDIKYLVVKGVPCILVDSGSGTAISCDWTQRPAQ